MTSLKTCFHTPHPKNVMSSLVSVSFDCCVEITSACSHLRSYLDSIADCRKWACLCHGGRGCLLFSGQLPYVWTIVWTETRWKSGRRASYCWQSQEEPCRLCSLEGQGPHSWWGRIPDLDSFSCKILIYAQLLDANHKTMQIMCRVFDFAHSSLQPWVATIQRIVWLSKVNWHPMYLCLDFATVKSLFVSDVV